MMFLFTTSQKIGARAIRWALDEPCSHFATVFDENESGYGIVFHSTMSQGVNFTWFKDFYQKNKIVYALKPKHTSLMHEESVYQAIVGGAYGRGYDYLALGAFAYYAVRRKLSGHAMPSSTRFGVNNRFLCSELSAKIKQMKPEYVPNSLPSELISPYALYQNMSQSKELERVPWIANRL